MEKKRTFINHILFSVAASILITVPAFASEPASSGGGYIPMEWDSEVNMTDEDITLEEALDRIVSDDRDSAGSCKAESDDMCVLNATDYTPRSTLPSAFPANGVSDLTALKTYLKDKYPLPKNQGSFGTCWAHATAAMGEFYGINYHGYTKDIDLSELYLALSVYRTKTNKKVGNAEEGGGVTFTGTDREMIDFGSNYKFAAQLMTKGYGYVQESELPYASSSSDPRFNGSGNLKAEVLEKVDELDDGEIFHLSNMYLVDIGTDTGKKIVKEAIYRNGIVGLSYYDTGSSFHDYGSGIAAYSDVLIKKPGEGSPNLNHAISIVGWDDDFPVSNFNSSKHPENPGAWLVRNSWYDNESEFFARDGYYWLSYEDSSLTDTAGFEKSAYIYETTKTADDYDHVYYYNTQIHGTGNCSSSTHPNMDWFSANVFNGPAVDDEILNAVSIETDKNMDYEVKIYTGLTDPNNPESGTHVAEADTSGSLSFPGIYTIPLNDPVVLKKGKSFSVVVKTGGQSIDYETAWDGGKPSVTCGIKEGQSFFKYDYPGIEWADMKGRKGNFCISAYTSDIPIVIDPSVFSCSFPSEERYDGTSKKAEITTPLDVGDITVFYNGGDGWTDEVPVKPGTYKVRVSTSGSEKYPAVSNITDESWSFTIEKGKITVTADDKTVKKGSEMPSFTYTLTGFSNGDPFMIKPAFECAVSDTLTEGSFDIIPGGGVLRDPECFEEPEYVKGTLKITPDEGGESEDDPGKEEVKKDEPFTNTSGETAILVHDTKNNTYETKTGESVVALSTVSGNSFPLSGYEYTGKKITPGKKGYVIYEGVLYRYKKDYTISFKRNKKPGTARAVIRWKRRTAPRLSGVKKSTTYFDIRPRAVTADMVNISLNKKGRIRKLTVHTDGLMIKATKKDYYYTGNIIDGFSIVFKNNFTGTIEK